MDADALAAELATGELVFDRAVGPFLLRDCGHFVQWEAAAVLVRTVIGFCPDPLAQTGW